MLGLITSGKAFNVNKVIFIWQGTLEQNFGKYATRTNETNIKNELIKEALFNFTLVHALTINRIIFTTQ